MRRVPLLLLVTLCAAAASADVVVQRWGVGGRVQHPGTLRFKDDGARGTLMAFDLSALPQGARLGPLTFPTCRTTIQ